MGAHERHEIAGVDDHARGFTRSAEVHAVDTGFSARLRYEQSLVVGDPGATERDAVLRLVTALHARGYTQLRSRLSFAGDQYLGSQEPWIEYPDPPPPGLLARLRTILGRLRPARSRPE